MKKVIILALVVFAFSLAFPSCSYNNTCNEHIWGEYQYNEHVHWREYICGCPWPENIADHIDANKDNKCDVCSYKYNVNKYNRYFSDQYPWILDITASEVAEIQMIHHIMNSDLGSYDNVYSIIDKESIADFINQCQSLTMYKIAGFEPAPNSAKYFYTITLNDKTEYTFYIYCGFLDGNWHLKYQPNITQYSTVKHAYSFVLNLPFGQVYTYSNSSERICCLNNMNDLRFEVINNDDAPKNEPTHIIEINHITLYVLNGNTFYYYNGNEEQIYCHLTCGDFYQIFEEFSVTYQMLLDAFLSKNSELTTATVDKYFCTTESGAIIALITSPEIEYPEESTISWIDGTPIKNFSKVFVLYQNELYSIGTAYQNGIITKNDLKTIYLMQ